MEINFFTGASGSGKSKLLYDTLIREAADGLSKRLFLVVPEQYTMMTQKNIVKAHPGHGTFNIDIVSFNRLAYRVFEELGISLLTVIDDTGKNLILRKVIDDNRDKLKIIKVKDSQGFVSEIKSIISELLQYSVTFSMLENAKELYDIVTTKVNEITNQNFKELAKHLNDAYYAYVFLLCGLNLIINAYNKKQPQTTLKQIENVPELPDIEVFSDTNISDFIKIFVASLPTLVVN